MRVIHKPDVRDCFILPERWTATSIKVLSEWLDDYIFEWTPTFHIDMGLILSHKTKQQTFIIDFGRVVYINVNKPDVIGECSQSYINEEFYRIDDASI